MLNRKLTDAIVREIRAAYQPGPGLGRARRPNSLGSLAHRYGVSKNTIAKIVHGLKWGHVAAV